MINELMNMPIILYIIAGLTGLFLLLICIIITLCIKNSGKKILLSAQQKQIEELNLQNAQIYEVNSGLTAENMRLNTEIKNLHH